MINFKNKSLVLSVLLLTLGCTAFLSKKNYPSKVENNVSKTSLLSDSRCSFDNRVRDSLEERLVDSMCYLIENHSYRDGFLNANSYKTRKEQVDSLGKMIREKENKLNEVARFRSVSAQGWSELSAFQDEISKLKKDQRFIEAAMKSYRLQSKL